MNKLGQYHDDDRGQYNLSFSDSDGKHISVSFRAEPDYDLDVVFNEFRNFLIASGHDVEGPIGELYRNDEDNGDYDDEIIQSWSEDSNKGSQIHQDKFSMDHLPNNGWPFGNLTTASIAPLTVTNLDTLTSQSYADWAGINKYATMAPITQEQVKSWSFDTKEIQALTSADLSQWRVDAPGTIGGAKVNFK